MEGGGGAYKLPEMVSHTGAVIGNIQASFFTIGIDAAKDNGYGDEKQIRKCME